MVKVPESKDDLTDKQEEILEKALENPDKSAERIATETDSSASYVREVRRDLEDKAKLEEKETGGGGGFIVLLILVAAGIWFLIQSGAI